MNDRILVIGSSGQIGTELVIELRNIYGDNNVIASDIRPSSERIMSSGPFEKFDVLDKNNLYQVVKKYNISQVYLLAALLSATAEKDIEFGWKLNIRSHSNVLDLAREGLVKKIFWPSSIAVFGPKTPKELTPQYTIMDPNTVYGITKLSGERWNQYYFNRFGVDIRSLRYPGLIGWRAKAGGGTTDYAVNIFHDAILNRRYECFLNKETALPMMYMPDAISATIQMMESPSSDIKIRSSYNLAGICLKPQDIVKEVIKYIPDFKITYNPDFRQQIADSWPSSIDDSCAVNDWGWKLKYNLKEMTDDIMRNLTKKYSKKNILI